MPELSELIPPDLRPPFLSAAQDLSKAATASSMTGIEPRVLLEELRAKHQQTEPDFSQLTATAPSPALLKTEPPSIAPTAINSPMLATSTVVVTEAGKAKVGEAPAAKEAFVTESVTTSESTQAALLEKHLIFSLGDLRYAVPLGHILEIAELEQYTPVPNVPDWILGITNLRGDIISLVDLRRLNGDTIEEVAHGSNLLVTSTAAGDLTTCLVVDRVHGVSNVNVDQIEHFDRVGHQGLSTYTRGYVAEGASLLCLIDLESLLRSLEI